MQGKPTDKLPMRERHHLFGSRHSIILAIESHVLSVDIPDSVVANGDFVGVSSQVFHHHFGASKRLFGKNHPIFLPQFGADSLIIYRGFGLKYQIDL